MTRGGTSEFPGHGAPCTGCGLCCMAEPCELADMFLGKPSAPCPALEFEDGRHWCGLVRRPHHYIADMAGKPWADSVLQPMFAAALGLGAGCDSMPPDEVSA